MIAPRIVDDWRAVLRMLKFDWNSYGAPPISEAAIRALESFVVVPTSQGGLQLESQEFDIEIEIDAAGNLVPYEP
jgi:hypothetical protein